MSDSDTQEIDVEGFEEPNSGLDTYPVDSLLIRTEQRTISDVLRRIDRKAIKLDPDFQRDFVWGEDYVRQSRLIESILMRIPLPVFYLAEEKDGRLIVVDGLQRLSTMKSFYAGELTLDLPRSTELHGKRFLNLPQRLKDRFEDGQLTFYLIDHRVPDRVRLDIFDRVNSGVPLTRQQMRNAIYNGPATAFLKNMVSSDPFKEATSGALSRIRHVQDMRDREAVNRFLSFYLLGWDRSPDWDFDDRLGLALLHFNRMSQEQQTAIGEAFLTSMRANYRVFGDAAFHQAKVADLLIDP